MPEFDRIVTSPKARRAISILMSQTSAPPLSQVQVQMAAPRNALRQQPLDTSTLPGAGAFVSRSSKMPPDLFLSPTMILDPQSAYKVTVSPEGMTATVTLSSVGQMVVGTEGDTMESHFGSVVVEREYTQIVVYQPNETIRLDVRLENETVLKLISSAKRSLILIDNWATPEVLDLFAKKRALGKCCQCDNVASCQFQFPIEEAA